MLSAFTARPIIELRQRDKSKIETILAYGDRVLVGLNTGVLRIYRLNDLSANGSSLPAHTAPASKSKNASDRPPGDSKATTTQDGSAPPPSPAKPPPKSTDLLREVEKFSTRSIEQLAIIKEANVLVSLSNYAVSLHDLNTFEPVEAPLAKSKNASCFAVTSNIVKDPATGIPEIISRLAVAVKRRLLLWNWHESELSPAVAEVVLPEAIRSVTWANATKIVCGMNSDYILVDVLTHETTVITGGSIGATASGGQAGGGAGGLGAGRFGAYGTAGMGYMGLGGYMPKPLATKLADGQMLLAKDINTMFVTDEGKPVEKRQIPWQAAPESIGYSYPYILALQPPAKGSLEVRNPDTLSLLQTIALPGAAQLHFPTPTSSLAHAGKGFHISSDRCVWKMGATNYDKQVAELVSRELYDEAISLLNMLEDALLRNKTEMLRSVKMQKAELLFRQRKFQQSMDLFNEDSVDAPPERVLKLFPRIIAGDLSGFPIHHEGSVTTADARADEPENEDANGKAGPDDKSAAQKAEPPTAEATTPSRAGGFTRMFLGHRKAESDTASIASTAKKAPADDASDSASIAKLKPGESETGAALEGKDLKNAVFELNSYLAGARARLQRVIDPVTGKLKPRGGGTSGGDKSAEEAFKSLLSVHTDESDEQLEAELQRTFRLVDTTLFRAYMFSNPRLVGPLFNIPNFCDPDVVNERLLEHNSYDQLVAFFSGKKLHRQALGLLRKFGEGERPNEVAASLHGPEQTVRYLQKLPPEMIDLILEFSEWTLRADPELGMEVFIADTEKAETLPRDRVVAFLGRIDARLEVRYLEHVITELNDLTPDFHNRLVDLFIRELKSRTTRDEAWERDMARLVKFLDGSRQYGLNKAFALIPRDDPAFYEAQAVVLSIMGQHRQALEIYVFKMRDFAKAEEYCNRIHKAETERASPRTATGTTPSSPSSEAFPDDDDEPSIYHTLLSLYLNPPRHHASSPPPPPPSSASSPPPASSSSTTTTTTTTTTAASLAPALDLLSRHGSRLPASSTLQLVPDSLPVSALESYFRGRIRSANSVVNEGRVVVGLRKAELFAAQGMLLLGDDDSGVGGGGLGVSRHSGGGGGGGRNRRVVVTDERACGVCNKRLGGSVLAVLPDNTVVHYGCLGKTGSGGGGSGGGGFGGLRDYKGRDRVGSWGRSAAY